MVEEGFPACSGTEEPAGCPSAWVGAPLHTPTHGTGRHTRAQPRDTVTPPENIESCSSIDAGLDPLGMS